MAPALRVRPGGPRAALRAMGVVGIALALALAPAARAQLGIDLTPPQQSGKKPAPKKKPSTAQKPAPARKLPRKLEAAPAAPPAPPPAATPPAAPPPAAPAAPYQEAKKDLPALDLSKPAPPPPARKAAPTKALGIELGKAASGVAKERLDAAKKLLEGGSEEKAALALDEILRDPQLATAQDEARYQLGKALFRLELPHSALTTFDEVLDRGPQGTRFYGSSMEWLFSVGSRLKNEQPLLSRVARHAREAFPPGYEDRFHFLLSKYEFERGRALADAGRTREAATAWADSAKLASLVREQAGAGDPKGGADAPTANEGDTYARARFVDGLVRYAQGDDVGAIDSFKDAVRLTNPKRGRRVDSEVRELAFLQLARIHYQNRQNRYAIWYYDRMPWGGENWLEGLWEASYAYYRVGDYEKTLGNLLTLQSPYFQDEYFPESYVLKAIVYYENCRYPEARLVLETLNSIYEPVFDELTRITGTPQAPAAYYDVVGLEHQGGSAVSRKIRKLAFTDQNVRRLVQSVQEVEHEMDVGIGERKQLKDTPLGKRLVQQLAAEKAALVEEAGARTKATLEYERDALRTLLAQALRIQIEVSRKEREALEGSLAAGYQVDVVRDLKFSYAVSDEHLYWPYEGEFWRDELGTFSYTLTRGCKDRLHGTERAESPKAAAPRAEPAASK